MRNCAGPGMIAIVCPWRLTYQEDSAEWAALAICLFAPQPSQAIPAFARKYGVKCYSCHIIPPALNKNGYMFKRLGYRMPPDEMDGSKPAPKVRELDSNIKWTLTNALALVAQGSFTVDKTEGDQPASNTSFNLDKALLFTGGSIPQTPFSYFAEFKLYEDGESAIKQAVLAYTGGRANSSYFGKVGMMHAQEGDGTRAAMMFSLFPDPALTLTNTSPINFTLDERKHHGKSVLPSPLGPHLPSAEAAFRSVGDA